MPKRKDFALRGGTTGFLAPPGGSRTWRDWHARVGSTEPSFAAARRPDGLPQEKRCPCVHRARRTASMNSCHSCVPHWMAGVHVDFYLSVRHKEARDSSCPLASLAADLPRLDPAARECVGAGLSRLIGAFANLLFALKGGDCEPLAMSALAEMVGALSLARGVDDPRQSKMVFKHARDLLKVRASEPASRRTGAPSRPTVSRQLGATAVDTALVARELALEVLASCPPRQRLRAASATQTVCWRLVSPRALGRRSDMIMHGLM